MGSHPHAQFKCRSRDELICKWRRGTILRCCITTEINRTLETGLRVVDLEPLGSLYHSKCVNNNCKWDIKRQHIMRLEKSQLVTHEISAGQLSACELGKRGNGTGHAKMSTLGIWKLSRFRKIRTRDVPSHCRTPRALRSPINCRVRTHLQYHLNRYHPLQQNQPRSHIGKGRGTSLAPLVEGPDQSPNRSLPQILPIHMTPPRNEHGRTTKGSTPM